MLKVDLRHAEPGMTLALPVLHPQCTDRVLLRVGYRLERRIFPRLEELGIRALWVRCPGLDFLADYVRLDVVEAQNAVVHSVARTFAELQSVASPRISYQAYCHSIGSLIERLVSNPAAALFLDDLVAPEMHGFDLLRHSSTVAYLSVLMGLKLEGYLVKQRRHIDPIHAKEVISLGVGALLHDIGIGQLAPETRERWLQTRDDSDPAWREHPSVGYRMVRGQIEPSAATVVLNHHQRCDGSGYGGASVPVLSGQRIHIFARIAALADHFDQARQVGGAAQPTVAVLRRLLEPHALRQFDPLVIAALLAVAPPYPPGSLLRLTDESWAVCIQHHPADPCRPSVLPIPAPPQLFAGRLPRDPPLDLAQANASIAVAECGGLDVHELNFPSPPFLRDAVRSLSCW